MINKKEYILICERHTYQVPLLWTFAFNGSEYWCPYCGYQGGMFGTGEKAKETQKLIDRQKGYRKLSKKFLNARGTLICSSTMWKGERISPRDLPDREKARLKKVVTSWKYKQKISCLKSM